MPPDEKEIVAVLVPVPTKLWWLEDIQDFLPLTEAFAE